VQDRIKLETARQSIGSIFMAPVKSVFRESESLFGRRPVAATCAPIVGAQATPFWGWRWRSRQYDDTLGRRMAFSGATAAS
jgi:hypothetical protein